MCSQKLSVLLDGTLKITRFLLVNGVLDQGLRRLGPSDNTKTQNQKESGFPHTCYRVPGGKLATFAGALSLRRAASSCSVLKSCSLKPVLKTTRPRLSTKKAL